MKQITPAVKEQVSMVRSCEKCGIVIDIFGEARGQVQVNETAQLLIANAVR
jgi:hypothetical protein